MKWLKDNWLLIVVCIIIGFAIMYMGHCVGKQEIGELKKAHDEAEKVSKKKIEKYEAEQVLSQEKIDKLTEDYERIIKEAEAIGKKNQELEKQIKNIPKPTGKFKTLPGCQLQFDILWLDYENRGEHIVGLQLELSKYKETKAPVEEKDKEQDKKDESVKIETDELKEQAKRDKAYTNALEKKLQQSWFAVTFGPYYDPFKGHGGISINLGVNLTSLLKKLF